MITCSDFVVVWDCGVGEGGGEGSGVFSPSAFNRTFPVSGQSVKGLGGLSGSNGGKS